MEMGKEKKVCVVGAGVSGLAACKYLVQRGFKPVLFESDRTIGGVWARTLSTTRLQSEQQEYHFSDFPWPDSLVEINPDSGQVMEYIESYARRFDLLQHVRFGRRVVGLEYVGDTEEEMEAWDLWAGAGDAFGGDRRGAWHVTVRSEEDKVYEMDFVILCLGRFSGLPNIPRFPVKKGPEVFSGEVIHSMDYSNMSNSAAAELIKGKHITIVGFRKSALDIATECANANGTEYPCTMLVRTKRWNIPNFTAWGLPLSYLYLNRFSELLFHKPEEGLLLSILATLLSPLAWLISKFAESYFKKATPIKKHGMVPEHGFSEAVSSCLISMLPPHFYEKVEEGSIVLKPSKMFEFCNNGIIFEGETSVIKTDLVIFATGFKGDQKLRDIFVSPRYQKIVFGSPDSSVPLYRDWYNLEKSKRVRPFRCGEFDACIEKAEASYSTPIKRREKYARREDAIFHALELEGQQREIKQKSTTAGNIILSICERDSNQYTSETHVQSKLSNQKSQSSSRKVTPSLDEYYLDHPLLLHRNRQVKPENDKYKISTHARVQNVGTEIFESEGMLIHSVSGANSYVTDESQLDLLPQGGHNSVFITQAASCKNFSIPKRKSLPTGPINDTPTKRRDRRRPLVKVLQSSIKLPVSYSLQPHRDSSNIISGEENHADITHGAQQDITVYSSHDTEDPLYYSKNSLKHPPVDAGNAYHLQHSGSMSNESTPSGWTEGNEFDSSATDSEFEIVEEKLRSGITQPFEINSESPMKSGMSQWHLKGKRKNRTTTTRLHESFDEKKLGTEKSDVQLKDASPDKFESAMINDSIGQKFSSEKDSDYDTEDDELFAGIESKRDDLLSQNSDYIDSDDDSQLYSQTGWGSVSPFPTWRAYWDGPENGQERFYGSPFYRRMMPMLVDVDLKVQARYQGEYVPLISVVSKLNGKAIIGHCVRIEVLEDGSTDIFLLPSNESEEDTIPLQILRTAKRTVPRVPRANHNRLKSLYLENSAPRMKKKSIYHSHRSASGRFQRKPPKTTSFSSSQKTRALSSFVSEKQLGGGGVFSSGLTKPDGSIPPTACISTKVVFTRIIESLGKPMGPTRL